MAFNPYAMGSLVEDVVVLVTIEYVVMTPNELS